MKLSKVSVTPGRISTGRCKQRWACRLEAGKIQASHVGNSTESELNSSLPEPNCFVKYLWKVVWGFCLHCALVHSAALCSQLQAVLPEEIPAWTLLAKLAPAWHHQNFPGRSMASVRAGPETWLEVQETSKTKLPERQCCRKRWGPAKGQRWLPGGQKLKLSPGSCRRHRLNPRLPSQDRDLSVRTKRQRLPVRESA